MATIHERTPLERVESLYEELVHGYGDGVDRETRAASKLLMVALLKLKEQDEFGWQGLVEEYLHILQNDPGYYQKMLDSNRGKGKGTSP
jgi:hypothetical protein